MRHGTRGFTLIEMMIAVTVIGILAAIAIPNFLAMQKRAREGSTKANMHTFQLAAEDYGVQNDGTYARTADLVAQLLPNSGLSFRNPFDGKTGNGAAWTDQPAYSPVMGTGTGIRGIVAYADDAAVKYCIAAHGADALLALHLTSGQ